MARPHPVWVLSMPCTFELPQWQRSFLLVLQSFILPRLLLACGVGGCLPQFSQCFTSFSALVCRLCMLKGDGLPPDDAVLRLGPASCEFGVQHRSTQCAHPSRSSYDHCLPDSDNCTSLFFAPEGDHLFHCVLCWMVRGVRSVAILAQAISCSNVLGVFPFHERFWFCPVQFCSFLSFLMAREQMCR